MRVYGCALASLKPEEIYILLKNLRHVFASGNPDDYLLPDSALEAFLNHCNKTIGSAYFTTPRNTIKAFLDLLAVLEQNPQIQWDDLIQAVSIAAEYSTDMDMAEGEDEENGLAEFKL